MMMETEADTILATFLKISLFPIYVNFTSRRNCHHIHFHRRKSPYSKISIEIAQNFVFCSSLAERDASFLLFPFLFAIACTFAEKNLSIF